MEGFFLGVNLLPQSGWAMRYRNRIVVIPDEVIAHIRANSIKMPGWFEEELGQVWKNIFPLTPTSIRSGNHDHLAWNFTPNPWWKFLTAVPAVSTKASEELSRQRRPSIMPHWDESSWII